MKKVVFPAFLALVLTAVIGAVASQSAQACGGFFCQNSPIDQNAERIIFTQNHDGTVSAYVQIQYTGSAPDFSWILPLPEAIGEDDLEVPEDAMAAFTELEVVTDPIFIPPVFPECAQRAFRAMPEVAMSAADSVEVFASGEVGPFGFDVIGSEDPNALIEWLRENNYRVTEPMEPLINVYVQEQFVFLAMRLLPESGVQDIQPVKITYPSQSPMIPLRLTAVAANPDMAVMTWIYAEHQATPVNYTKMEIADEELTFFAFGGSNYRQLMGERADEHDGRAFITEFAGPTRELPVRHPLLQELGERFPYVTRLNTVISPEEMTVDPIFDYDPELADVSNVHDLSKARGLFDCEREEGTPINMPVASNTDSSPNRINPNSDISTTNPSVDNTNNPQSETPPSVLGGDDDASGNVALAVTAGIIGGLVLLFGGALGIRARMGRREG